MHYTWCTGLFESGKDEIQISTLTVEKTSHMADGNTSQNRSAPLICVVYGPTAQPDGFAALAAEWNPLLKRSRFDNFFLTHEWQTTWWSQLGEGDLWILAFRRPEDGTLVGICAFYLVTISAGPKAGQRHLNLVGCIEVSDYLDVIAAEGWEEAVYRSLLTWLTGPDAPEWDVVDLCNLAEDSLTYRTLPPIFTAAGFQVEVLQEDTAPQFALPLHYEDVPAGPGGQKAAPRDPAQTTPGGAGGSGRIHAGGQRALLAAEVDDFVALQRASRADKADFMTPAMHRFFQTVAERMLAAGTLRLFFLSLDGEKAATLFAFEYDRRFWLYNSGYDPDSHAQLSPGWVLLAYAIQYAIATGCQRL